MFHGKVSLRSVSEWLSGVEWKVKTSEFRRMNCQGWTKSSGQAQPQAEPQHHVLWWLCGSVAILAAPTALLQSYPLGEGDPRVSVCRDGDGGASWSFHSEPLAAPNRPQLLSSAPHHTGIRIKPVMSSQMNPSLCPKARVWRAGCRPRQGWCTQAIRTSHSLCAFDWRALSPQNCRWKEAFSTAFESQGQSAQRINKQLLDLALL